ncbi:unnamed protein product [Ceratitis capitata]|uniref:(Mediterranean fruit fly) hypothetical protein n=1 Tax=Ceratitis capitata TaxID=7213 RepID=A0A811UMB9_CERCA|nr:unnamed protein product [Ceratitis capitata]
MYQWHRHFLKVLILLFGCVCLSEQLTHTPGYSQVLVSGSDNANDEGPKIFKALNMDLIYPRTFNTSETILSTTAAPLVPPVIAESMQQAQKQQEQNISPYDEQSKPYAAEQPIFYVTPATNNLQQENRSNYENNMELSPPSQATDTSKHTSDENPVLPIDIVKEQSDVYGMPAEPSPTLQDDVSTGRAVDYNRPSYNFNQLITPLIKSPPPIPAPTLRERPVTTSNIGKIIYPQTFNQRRPPNIAEINKLSGKAPFSDRFTPGEAVAAGQFTRHHNHNHNHNHNHAHPPSNGNTKVAAASQIVQQTYKPPENIYSFPPNINSHYKSPYKDPNAALPSSNVNSYAATPSGPVQTNSNYKLVAAASNNDAGYKYPGPTNPENLPAAGGGNDAAKIPMPAGNDDQKNMNGAVGGDGDADNGSDDIIGVLPASAMDGDAGKNAGGNDAGADDSNTGDDAGAMAGDHDHDHPPPVDDTEYPTPPPGWMEEQPDVAPAQPVIHDTYHDIHSDHSYGFHDHFPAYPQYFHHYPEIIYDDHHHHDHHTYPPPTLPPVTTEMPPPEPPPEPRVKKYSYFYIGRKLWYVPLYFTVWFSFYVLWLILKSIARHKVNLPNHYVSKRSLPDFGVTETRANEYINDLTVSVLEKIENFQHKYLT